MASITLEALSKSFDGAEALVDIDLTIADGEFLVVLGPSGCGKTTLLRLVGGLDKPTSGQVRFDDEVVNDVPARNRNVAMIFQEAALYEHFTAAENMAFPLRVKKTDPATTRTRVEDEASHLGIRSLLSRRPRQLAAGHRQSVAMGRALVRDSTMYLMDEPLALLDTRARVRLRGEIQKLHERTGSTIVYVTNDQSEAMVLADRLAILKDGRLLQVDGPRRVYEDPCDIFVGQFVGSPPMNIVRTRLQMADGQGWLSLGDDQIRVEPEILAERPGLAHYRDREIAVGLRPSHVALAQPGEPFDRCLHATVNRVEHLGTEQMMHLAFGSPDSGALDFVARAGPDDEVSVGDNVELRVALSKASFFDPETGRAIRG